MGLTSSVEAQSSAGTSQEQEDVKFLGKCMPFGDAELVHVYRAYQTLNNNNNNNNRISFLTDIGCLTIPNNMKEGNKQVEDRMVLLQALEQKILPENFGNRLYETCFLRSADRANSEYRNGNDNNNVNNNDNNNNADAYTRRAQLEAFFEGLSNCTRRGNTKSIQVLFRCCQPYQAKFIPANASSSTTTTTTTTVQDDSPPVPVIQPLELVTIGYRVGLASAFLTFASKPPQPKQPGEEGDEVEEDNDISRFFPEDASTTQTTHEGLESLAASLIDFANKRRARHYKTMVPLSNQNDTDKTTATDDTTTSTSSLVSEQEVQEWTEQVAPILGSALASLTHSIFFPHVPYPPTRTSFDFPSLAGFESSFFTLESSPLLFSFGCMSPALGGEYYRLYTSASDGLSFNRLQNALVGYGGPTLLIIQSGDCLFGAFTASPWKESKDFYGNHDCFLYQLLPKTAVFRPSGNASNFMYCNSFARSRGYDQQAHGIGFGGTVDQPRLFIAESFDNCRAAAQDMTFESGRLLDSKSLQFEIDNLEVWGVGGTQVVQEALGARSRQRDIKHAAIQKARKVDKAQFLDDFRSGLIDSKAFAHRQQIRGREGAAIDDDNPNKYKYEGEDGIVH